PEMIGGSADLTGSNRTWIEGSRSIQKGSYGERNIYFGVREHAMAAIINGLAVHGGLIPFCGTFLVFSDYMRPAIRLSAMSSYPSIWVFTHDSIGLGEDGPTHQPIEHLSSLRAIPRLVVIRPCDANEVVEAWRVALKRRDGPTVLVLTRQNVPTIDRSMYAPPTGLHRGAYVLKDMGAGEPQVVLMASGSEVPIAIDAAEKIAGNGVPVRVVSFPSWELFEMQSAEYQQSVLLSGEVVRVAIEAGVSQGWDRWLGEKGLMFSLESFGASAPYKVLYEKFGFTPENVAAKVLSYLKGLDH
ncbi:MAG: transketolase C-terminal domain-containing protein, partial [Candidatus Thorarchaeota archaeon]